MKTQILTGMIAIAATFTGLNVRGLCQTSGSTGEGTPSAPMEVQRRTGFAVQNGVVYFVRNGRANPVGEDLLPKGQVMTATGRLAPATTPVDGFILREGVVYYSRAGTMQRIDAGMVSGGQLITLEGTLVSLPNGIISFPGVQAVTVPVPRSGNAEER